MRSATVSESSEKQCKREVVLKAKATPRRTLLLRGLRSSGTPHLTYEPSNATPPIDGEIKYEPEVYREQYKRDRHEDQTSSQNWSAFILADGTVWPSKKRTIAPEQKLEEHDGYEDQQNDKTHGGSVQPNVGVNAGWPGLLRAGCVSTRNIESTCCEAEHENLLNVHPEVSCATHLA